LVATALLVGSAVLLVGGPHALGTADNCDFARVMQRAQLKHLLAPGEKPDWETLHTDFRRYYAFAAARPGASLSRFALYSLPATSMARAVSGVYRWLLPTRPLFDISYLGLTYLLLGLLLLGLVLRREAARRARASLLLALLLLLAFVDPEYLLLLNSFYCEPVAFVALLGLGVSLCRGRTTRGSVIAASACVLVLSLTKLQFIGSGLLLLASLLSSMLFSRLRKRPREPFGWFAWSCVVAGAALPLSIYRPSDNAYRSVNRFDAIFDGVLADTSAAETDRVMAKLGLDPSLKWLTGASFWTRSQLEKRAARADLPADAVTSSSSLVRLDPARWMHVSLVPLATLYVAEPVVAAHLLQVSERNLTRHDPTQLSNYAKGEHPLVGDRFYYHARGPYIGWLRERLAALPWPLFSALQLAVLFVALRGLWRSEPAQRGRWLALNFLLWFAFTQVVVVVLGDGYESFERHLFASRFALDLALAIGCAMALETALKLVDRRAVSSAVRAIGMSAPDHGA
jgi:hypothetical protein